jgi:hypothetical protein
MISPADKAKILKANTANIVRKVKAGKPLTKAEMGLIAEAPEGEVKTKKGRPPKGNSVYSLAQESGIDQRTVRKRLVDAGLFPPDDHPRQKLIDAIKPTKGNGDGTIKEQKTFEEWRKLKIFNDKEDGLLITKASVIGSIQRLNPKIDALIEQKIVNEYPAAVAGLDVPAAREFGKRFADELRREWAAFKEEWKG